MIAGLIADVRTGTHLGGEGDWHGRATLLAGIPGVERVRFGAAVDVPATVVTIVESSSVTVLDEVEAAIREADAAARMEGASPVTGDVLRHEFVAEFLNTGYAPETIGAVQLVWMTPGDADELARWYADEHVALLFRVPGWLRTRRFRSITPGTPNWLALHELESPGVATDPAGDPARSTPWRNRVVAAADSYRRITVELAAG